MMLHDRNGIYIGDTREYERLLGRTGSKDQVRPADPGSTSIGEMSMPIMIAVGAVCVIIGVAVIIKGLHI